MPLIKVQTTVAIADVEVDRLLKQLSASLARHVSKPEAYVMTMLEAVTAMTFGGTSAPTCYLEVKNVGSLTPTLTQAMSQDFCHQVHTVLGVPSDRIYIEFSNVAGAMWGWNGTTLS